MATPDESSPVLPYADVVTRWGVSAQTIGGVTRVIVPPLPGWRYLGKWFYIGGVLLAAMVALISWGMWTGAQPGGFVALAAYGGGLFAVVLAAFYRMHRYLILEVDGRTVRVRSSYPWLAGPRAWPRDSVGEIRLNRSSGNLLLRITGKDQVDVFVSPSREVTAWVARTLDDALRGTPPQPLSTPIPARRAGPASRIVRAALIALGLAMFAGGIAMAFMDLPWRVLGIYTVIFSGAPLGMALGTQKKEFYL